MQRGEGQRHVAAALQRDLAQLVPAIPHRDALLFETPQQRHRVRNVAEIVGRVRPHLAIVER
jgi:hypothetical protein